MDPDPALVRTIALHRGLLFGLCYRMLGNQADAEDLVQDTIERALRKPPADLERDAKAWLVRVAMNACRDHLRANKRRKEAATWLPSPVLTPSDDQAYAASYGPEARYGQLESLSVAFLRALQQLGPSQRAVLLLRDVFDFSVRETAEMLELSEANVKTTLHRARSAMASYVPQCAPPSSRQTRQAARALRALFFHVQTGNRAAVCALLTDDVLLVNDADDELFAARRPVVGPRKVELFLRKTLQIHRQRAADADRAKLVWLNGQLALIAATPATDRRLPQRFVCWIETTDNGRIARIACQVDPRKLPLGLFDDMPMIGVREQLQALVSALGAPMPHRWLAPALRTGLRQLAQRASKLH